jgi:collagenase-like PrtC family protease
VKHRPEVLAPAGGWPQLTAAVENGADAVYFGVGDLNARARAANFTAEELPQVMEYLHERGVKGYLVLNVLIFDDELEILAEKAQHAAKSGVDAVIVQDIGAVEIIQKAAPGLAVHGSTQMTITSAEGAAFAGSRGIERVVVGRELSIRDIASVATGAATAESTEAVSASKHSIPEVEAFVHGALCVSYSGQCFSSEAWGGRSANRGQCAQACRLDYGLLVDGELKYLGDVQYLLSPQDLSAIELVPQLMLAGVTSFKIEGRLKGPEYVAMTTRVYREAVDAAWRDYMTSNGNNSIPEKYELDPVSTLELLQVFARGQDSVNTGLTPGFLIGPQHQMLVRGRAPRHRGVFLGHVERVISSNSGKRSGSSWSVVVKLAAPARRGDGIVFDQGNPQAEEFGGSIYEINVLDSNFSKSAQQEGRNGRSGSGGKNLSNSSGGRSVLDAEEGSLVEIVLGSGPHNSTTTGIKPGDLIWKNKDPILDSKLKTSYENVSSAERRRLSVSVQVTASLGNPLKITLFDEKGRKSEAETSLPIEIATGGRPLTAADVEKAVGVHLGDEGSLFAATFDFLNECEFEKGLFVSPGAIKDARRRAVAGLLEQQRLAPAMVAAVESAASKEESGEFKHVDDVLVEMRQSIATESRQWKHDETNNTKEAASMLRVLCRTKAQVDAAIQVPWLTEIVLDFLEVHGLKEACAAVKESGKRVVVASPRILKPDERKLWIFYLRLNADALLVRSAGLLHQLIQAGGPGAVVPGTEGHPIPVLEGDFSLNAANIITADVLLQSGLARLAPTHDCNADQLAALARGLGSRGRCLEAILHQNLPIFHTEHCVFARFLSEGNSYLDCGHPCEHHTVHLRGSEGTDHLVLADMGCRNTVFDGSAQSGLPFIDNLVRAGFGCFRIELVDQSSNMVAPLLEGYKAALEDSLNKLQNSSAQSAGSLDLEQQQQRIEASRRELWKWMDEKLTDANGRAQGVGTGSLQPRTERGVSTMKQTAAAKKAAASGTHTSKKQQGNKPNVQKL